MFHHLPFSHERHTRSIIINWIERVRCLIRGRKLIPKIFRYQALHSSAICWFPHNTQGHRNVPPFPQCRCRYDLHWVSYVTRYHTWRKEWRKPKNLQCKHFCRLWLFFSFSLRRLFTAKQLVSDSIFNASLKYRTNLFCVEISDCFHFLIFNKLKKSCLHFSVFVIVEWTIWTSKWHWNDSEFKGRSLLTFFGCFVMKFLFSPRDDSFWTEWLWPCFYLNSYIPPRAFSPNDWCSRHFQQHCLHLAVHQWNYADRIIDVEMKLIRVWNRPHRNVTKSMIASWHL